MGILDGLFGKRREVPADDPNALLRMAMGEGDKAGRSSAGHPICPNCGKEFPISIKRMERESDGIPVMTCPSCGKMASL